MTAPAAAGPAQRAVRVRAPRSGQTLRLRGSLAILGVLGLVALLAGVLAPYDPRAQDISAILQGPSGAHLLGTDDLGRDVLSRLIYGARVSLQASLLAVSIAALLGLPIGIIAGYFGGWVDNVLMRVVDTLLSFPAIILAIGITAALGPSLTNSMTAVGVVFAPSIARLMRAQIFAVKEAPFIEASRSFSCSGPRIVFRHILPNAIQPVLVQCAVLLGLALLAEASLSFLGLGVQPPDASWGSMLARAYSFISLAPLQIITPGIAIAVTVLAFNMLGDAAQLALDPRNRRRRD